MASKNLKIVKLPDGTFANASVTKSNHVKPREDSDDDEPVKRTYGRRMKSRPPTNEVGIRVIKYSEVSYAILGNTLPHREEIGKMGCKFNPNLKDPETRELVPGWVCRNVHKDDVIKMLQKVGAGYRVVEG